MKNTAVIILVLLVFFTVRISFGQQRDEANPRAFKADVGFTTGVLFSEFFQNPATEEYSNVNMTYENKYKAGISAGCFVSLNYRKHFSVQPEIFYNWIPHDIKYQYTSAYPSQWINSNITEANYSINTSLLQFSIIPKFIFGNKVQTFFGIGPLFNVIIGNKIHGQVKESGTNTSFYFVNDSVGYVPIATPYESIKNDGNISSPLRNNAGGLFAAIGLNIPYKEARFGVEFRGYWYPDNVFRTFQVRQRGFSINFVYQFCSLK